MLLNETVQKWKPILEFKDASPIKSSYRMGVTAQLLENQEKANLQEAAANNVGTGISYDAPATGAISGFNPVLISLVRRAMPNLIAYDVCGVQAMTGPTGLIFAMRSKYTTQGGTEALYNEANTGFSGVGTQTGSSATVSVDPSQVGYSTSTDEATVVGSAMSTHQGELLGSGDSGDLGFNDMAFSIEKVSVTAGTRALKAEYTVELAQDLKSVHGLEAEAELAQILSTEILSEINREVVRKINISASIGCKTGTTTTAGVFDLDTDSNGRWSVEKFKGLLFQIEREANQIAKDTRRGKGNLIICGSDVASALSMAGVLNYTEALTGKSEMQVDDTGVTFAGTIGGRIKVYVDPYFASASGEEYCTVGYRGTNPYDSGLFYCPYIPLQMVRALDPSTMQPKIAFRTRYGIVANPFATSAGTGVVGIHNNMYYRIFKISHLM